MMIFKGLNKFGDNYNPIFNNILQFIKSFNSIFALFSKQEKI